MKRALLIVGDMLLLVAFLCAWCNAVHIRTALARQAASIEGARYEIEDLQERLLDLHLELYRLRTTLAPTE